MLLYGDSHLLDFVRNVGLCQCFVPPGHVLAAARSPRGEQVQHQRTAPPL